MSAWQGQGHGQQPRQQHQHSRPPPPPPPPPPPQQQQQRQQQQQQWQQPQWQQPHWQPQWQPQWQPAPPASSSWLDPRLARPPSFYGANPALGAQDKPSAPVRPAAQGHNHHLPVPPAPVTSGWGVRYNQPRHGSGGTDDTASIGNGHKPPLPPRPDSIGPANNAPTATPPTAPPPSVGSQSWQNQSPQSQTGHGQQPSHRSGYQTPAGSATNQDPHHPQSSHSPASSQWPSPQPPPRPPSPLPPQSSPQRFQPQSIQSPASNRYPSPLPPQPSRPQSQPRPIQSPASNRQPSLPNVAHHQISHDGQTQPPQQRVVEPYQGLGQETNQHTGPARLPSQAQNSHVDHQPPVSPEEAQPLPWAGGPAAPPPNQHAGLESGSSASALGAGGPSDWEYLGRSEAEAGVADDGDPVEVEEHSERVAERDACVELPADVSKPPKRHPSLQSRTSHSWSVSSAQPVSVGTPQREHSVSPEASTEDLHRTGSIDGVIQAWTARSGHADPVPSSRKSSGSTPPRRSRRDGGEARPRERPAKEDPRPEKGCPPPTEGTRVMELDPYADLGPEYKASLARYVSMLRREEIAPEEARYQIFKTFMVKENRLRSVLYGVDLDEPRPPLPADGVATTKTEERMSTTPEPSQPTAADVSPPTRVPATAAAATVPVSATDQSTKLTLDTAAAAAAAPKAESERDQEADYEYSPGGRPRMSKTGPTTTRPHPRPQTPIPVGSPSDYAPIVIDDLPLSPVQARGSGVPGAVSRPGTAPPVGRSGSREGPIKFEPARAAYTPFRYAEDDARGSDPVHAARPAYQAYSALRKPGAGSGRVMGPGSVTVTSPASIERLRSPSGQTARREHEEAFLGLIREKSRGFRSGKAAEGPPSVLAVNGRPVADRVERPRAVMDSLRRMVPSTMPQQRRANGRVVEARRAIGRYPNVFTWIPDTVIAWDAENKGIRRRQEEARQGRQEDSETKIDRLFNDHEIGYSDIGHLEAEFKLAEATTRYEEDVQELGSFTARVFDPVTERLQEELSQLQTQYIRATDVLDLDADSGMPLMHGNGERAPRSDAMEIVLAIYERLEMRHIKLAEAQHERERRRKRLELSVLHTNGDGEAMQKLEQRFRTAEGQRALHEARAKDGRANRLMDLLDRATMQGLGENQRFVDEVVAKLDEVDRLQQAKGEAGSELAKAGLAETLGRVEELLDVVGQDSRQLLRLSNRADDLLNQADYEVSVAEARLGRAGAENMERLGQDKRQEDERIRAELDTRMGSVATGPAAAVAVLKRLMKRLGADDAEHQDRVQRALEAAKLRNAAKTPAGR